MKKVQLRKWQAEAIEKALSYFDKKKKNLFLINAAPGSGKTRAACVLAQRLFEKQLIDRVFVIAPLSKVVDQWEDDFADFTGKYMTRLSVDEIMGDGAFDRSLTWNAVGNFLGEIQAVCRDQKVLVVCDEIHHAAEGKTWGMNLRDAFADAKFILALTGTLARSDNKDIALLNPHPTEEASYTLTYGEAIKKGYCRPVYFHRHESEFTCKLRDGGSAIVSSKKDELKPIISNIKGGKFFEKTHNFERLIYYFDRHKDGKPKINGYHGAMLLEGNELLNEIRDRHPNAGGLIVAPSKEGAEYMCDLLLKMKEKPILVHDGIDDAKRRIDRFRKSKTLKWLVSVKMVSEGVDIPRLRFLLYIPSAMTEVFFRQAIGRVVRQEFNNDNNPAQVLMPRVRVLEEYAKRIREEIPKELKDIVIDEPKVCPKCGNELKEDDIRCSYCGYAPSKMQGRKRCDECAALNPLNAKTCHECGNSFSNIRFNYDEYLKELFVKAFVDGGIQGMDEFEQDILSEAAEWMRENSDEGTIIRIIELMGRDPSPADKAIIKKLFQDFKEEVTEAIINKLKDKGVTIPPDLA